jgi:hypothetical protein
MIRLHKSKLNFIIVNLVADQVAYRQSPDWKAKNDDLIGGRTLNTQYGVSEGDIEMQLAFKGEAEWKRFFNFVKTGEELLLVRPKKSDVTVSILNLSNLETSYDTRVHTVTITFTTARQWGFKTVSRFNTGDKLSFLEKLKELNEKGSDFIQNARNRIQGYTLAMTDIANELAVAGNTVSDSTALVTDTIDAVKLASSTVATGFNAVSNSITKVIFSIANIPSDVSAIYSEITGSIKGVFQAFSVPSSPSLENEVNMSNGLNMAYTISKKNVSDSFVGTSQNTKDIIKNIEITNIILKSAILLEVYDRFENLDNVYEVDISKYKAKIDEIIDGMTSSDYMSAALSYEMDLLKKRFATVYGTLLLNAKKTTIYKIPSGTYKNIMQIAYSINGNFNYVNDIKRLNKISNINFITGNIIVPYDE